MISQFQRVQVKVGHVCKLAGVVRYTTEDFSHHDQRQQQQQQQKHKKIKKKERKN